MFTSRELEVGTEMKDRLISNSIIQQANYDSATAAWTWRSSEETVHVAQFHHHSLQLGVILHCRPTVLSSKAWQKVGTNFVSVRSHDLSFQKPAAWKTPHHTWVLIPSERHFNGADVVVVDVAGPSLQLRRHAVGSRNIPADRNSGFVSSGRCSSSTKPHPSCSQLKCCLLQESTPNQAQQKWRSGEHARHLVKTPEASPKVVLLALWIASSSVSKAMTDMTGPKISSFTQVMSSLQLSVAEEEPLSRFSTTIKNQTDGSNAGVYQEHTGTWSNRLSVWGHWGREALLHKAQWLPANTSDWLMLDLKEGQHVRKRQTKVAAIPLRPLRKA